MLITQFLLIDAHFVISLTAALITFATAWLYFDAWLNKKDMRQTTSFLGFALLSLSFLAQSVLMEQAFLETSILGAETAFSLKAAFRIAGYLTLIIGQITVPLQPLPGYRKSGVKKAPAIIVPLLGIAFPQILEFTFPLLAVLTGFLYLRRATTGLEHHLKPISLSFFILSISELLGLSGFFRATNDIVLYNIVAPFGILWVLQRVVLIIAIFVLGRWAWSYLLKRLNSQLFMIFTTSTLFIFLVTSVFFTFATLNNIRKDVLANLKTEVGVLGYTLNSKENELLADAKVIAQTPEIATALSEENRETLANLTVPNLLANNLANLVIVTSDAKVVLRAEEIERRGESLSNNPYIQRALQNEEVSSVTTKQGVLAPIVTVRAAVPVILEGEIIGAVMVGFDIDNAFVDGVKDATDLDVSVYADNVRSATTFVAPDDKSRYIGIKEEKEEVKETVLIEGETYTGTTNLLNTSYFSAFSPIKNIDGNPIGMLFVGKPEVEVLQTASASIELIFVMTVSLLILSVIPSYFISKYMVEQLK